MISNKKPTPYSQNTREWGYLLKNGLKLFIAIQTIFILFAALIYAIKTENSIFWFFYILVFGILYLNIYSAPIYFTYICILTWITKIKFKHEFFRKSTYLLTVAIAILLLLYALNLINPKIFNALEKKSFSSLWDQSIREGFRTIGLTATLLMDSVIFYFLIHRPFINKNNL